jgi:hypothetical protein
VFERDDDGLREEGSHGMRKKGIISPVLNTESNGASCIVEKS